MRSPIRFMGHHNRTFWWDVCLGRFGWLVVNAGYFNKPRKPRVYWSPNGTPWHHGARSIFNARFVERQECVCEQCRPREES